ncbi:hypothetical protein CFD26_104744 [Aspergillus turcosus]|uniref:Uncharacterized protein n=1 Tax=Aspergillus turcosus TaxID=1245748 RepID=A0A3R7F7F2_9EURO|nr:hypothetical protein CFD26_104744 [Aspergillus turcosus]
MQNTPEEFAIPEDGIEQPSSLLLISQDREMERLVDIGVDVKHEGARGTTAAHLAAELQTDESASRSETKSEDPDDGESLLVARNLKGRTLEDFVRPYFNLLDRTANHRSILLRLWATSARARSDKKNRDRVPAFNKHLLLVSHSSLWPQSAKRNNQNHGRTLFIRSLAINFSADPKSWKHDVDILIFDRDNPNCTRAIRAELVSLIPRQFEERAQPIYFTGNPNGEIQVDIIPPDLPPYLPADAATLGEVNVNHLPFLTPLDLLVYKIHYYSMQPSHDK